MIASETSMSSTLPVMIGRKLKKPCTRVESEFRPRHELACRHPVEVREVERLEMVVHLVSQVVLHVEGDPASR